MIAPAAVRWLESRREELNQRFARQRHQHPKLEPKHVLTLIEQIIAPLAGEEPEADELCLNLFDLILLHAARDSFAMRPGISTLMCGTYPRLRKLLLRSPRGLPGSLCNAVENMGSKGVKFAEKLGMMADELVTPEILLGAGAFLAWRLGEARLRSQALATASTLPARVVLETLDLSGWPASAAAVALESLRDDAWHEPGRRISEQTLERLNRGTVTCDDLSRTLRSTPVPPLCEWQPNAHVGDFSGFDGSFDAPPAVLNGGDRHNFLVRSADGFYRITADCFGWVCRATADPGLDVRIPENASLWSRLGLRSAADDGKRLSPDGELCLDSERARFDALKEVTSFVPLERLVAFTRKNSYRVRLLGPPGTAI